MAMAITHTPIVITVIGVRGTGVMVDGVIMALGVQVTVVMVTKVMVGIADSTFSGQ
jgi:hypothetical protein